jgi:hypothetical protein
LRKFKGPLTGTLVYKDITSNETIVYLAAKIQGVFNEIQIIASSVEIVHKKRRENKNQ